MQEVWYQAPDWVTANPLALALYGLVGGAVVAVGLSYLHRRSSARRVAPVVHPQAISTGLINVSHLQVVGAGGLGIIVMCALVAIVIPPVGLSLAAGSVLGTAVAIALIARRRKTGPISSSSQRPGANTTLMIDDADQNVRD